MAKRKPSVITEKQKIVVEAKLRGATDTAAGVEAGFSDSGNAVRALAVKAALAEARSEITSVTTLSRLDVVEGILDAIQMARTMSDPGTMINGYDKLARIMGYNAPEVKKVELTVTGERMRSKMEIMSDEELMALAEGRAVVDGDFHVIN